jgi:hypothetical protein
MKMENKCELQHHLIYFLKSLNLDSKNKLWIANFDLV